MKGTEMHQWTQAVLLLDMNNCRMAYIGLLLIFEQGRYVFTHICLLGVSLRLSRINLNVKNRF